MNAALTFLLPQLIPLFAKGLLFSAVYFALTPDRSDLTARNVVLFSAMYAGAGAVLCHFAQAQIATLDMVIYGRIMELVFTRAYPAAKKH